MTESLTCRFCDREYERDEIHVGYEHGWNAAVDAALKLADARLEK